MLFAYIRRTFIYFYPVRSVVPEGVERDGDSFRKTTELQYGFSMKCPHALQSVNRMETSIQPAGFYIQREKRQAKIKNFRTLFSAEKFMLLAIQQNKDLINLQHQWETMPANEKNFLLCDQYVSD